MQSKAVPQTRLRLLFPLRGPETSITSEHDVSKAEVNEASARCLCPKGLPRKGFINQK